MRSRSRARLSARLTAQSRSRSTRRTLACSDVRSRLRGGEIHRRQKRESLDDSRRSAASKVQCGETRKSCGRPALARGLELPAQLAFWNIHRRRLVSWDFQNSRDLTKRDLRRLCSHERVASDSPLPRSVATRAEACASCRSRTSSRHSRVSSSRPARESSNKRQCSRDSESRACGCPL